MSADGHAPRVDDLGRYDLEAELTAARSTIAAYKEALAHALNDERTMHATLKATQARCTELLERVRLDDALLPLALAVARARAKHPHGCSLRTLLEEIGEVAKAQRHETPERVREELLDVACVAMRMYLGEICDANMEPELSRGGK